MGDRRLISGAGGGGKGGAKDNAPNSLRSGATVRIIDLLGEGEIKGLVNGSKSIFFDNTPLQDMYDIFNFEGISWDMRYGLPDQPYMEGFNSVESEEPVSIEVKKGTPIIRTIQGADLDAVRLTATIPALAKQDSDGSLQKNSVQFYFEIRYVGGSWTNVTGIQTIRGKCTSAYDKSYIVPLPKDPTGVSSSWEIRMVRLTDDSKDAIKNQNATYFGSITKITYGKFTYPYSAYIAMTVSAEQFGQSIPERTYEVYGRIIQVPSNYNPETRAYTGVWNGTFKWAWTDNPAWVLYDILQDDRFGLGDYIPIEQIDKWGLYEIAQYCDQLVPDGLGGMKPRFTFNGCITTQKEAFDAIASVASTFRGMAFWSSGSVMATQDRPADVSILAASSNTVEGSFTYQGSALKARHTVAIVKWNNPALNYEQDYVVVEDPEGLERYGYRETEIEAFGCTDRAQAIRMGEWALFTELNETQVIGYEAGLDHAGIRPGDIVAVQDPSIAGVENAGRLSQGSTSTSLRLDRDVTFTAGNSYSISVMLPNGKVEERNVTVSAYGTPTRVVNVVQPFGVTPEHETVWVLASSNLVPSLWKVLSLRETANHTYEVSATQHEPAKFAHIDNSARFDPLPVAGGNAVQPPKNLDVQETLHTNEGVATTSLLLSWQSPGIESVAVAYDVSYDGPNGFVGLGTIQSTSVTIPNATAGEYDFYVVSVGFNGRRSVAAVKNFTTEGWKASAQGVVQNLRLKGKERTETSFDGSDPEFVWDNVWTNVVLLPDGTNPVHRCNIVKVFDTATGQLLRTENVFTTSYVYTLEKNRQDNTPFSRGPSRAFRVEVAIQDVFNRITPYMALSVSNPPPAVITPQGLPGIGQFSVRWSPLSEADLAGYLVWISTTQGFNPLTTQPYYDGMVNAVTYGTDSPNKFYVRAAAYDTFGREGLNISGEIEVSAVTGVDTVPPAVPTGLTANSSEADVDPTTGLVNVTISWNDNEEDDLSGYILEVREGNSGSFIPYTVYGNSRQVQVRPSSLLTMRVLAFDTSWNKSAFTADYQYTSAKDTIPPPIPQNLVASPGIGSVWLKWDDASTEQNLFPYSDEYRMEQSGNFVIPQNVTPIPNQPSPYGNIASILREDYQENTHMLILNDGTTLGVNSVIPNDGVLSFRAKAGTRSMAYAIVAGVHMDGDEMVVNFQHIYFNLATGNVGLSSGFNPKMVSDGDGWYRCQTDVSKDMFGVPYSELMAFQLVIGISDGVDMPINEARTPMYQGVDGANSMLLSGVQLKEKGTSSAPVHTTGVAITREIPSAPDLSHFEIWGKSGSGSMQPVATSVGKEFAVTGLELGNTYTYAVIAVDLSGNKSGLSEEATVTTGSIPDVDLPTINGITFTPGQGDNKNRLDWTAGSITYNGGSETRNTIAGTATWVSGSLFVYYKRGTITLTAGNSLSSMYAEGGILLAIYKGGTDLQLVQGREYIDGGMILAQTIGANQMVLNEAVITGSAQIKDAIITSAKIVELDAAKITAGSILSGSVVVSGRTIGAMAQAATVFDNFSQDWIYHAGTVDGISYITGASDVQTGTRSFFNKNQNNIWSRSPDKIPFDPSKLYKITYKIRRQNDGVVGQYYLGVTAFREDGVTLVNSSGANATGSMYYPVKAGAPQSELSWTFQEVSGYIRGTSATYLGNGSISNPTRLHTDARFFSPLTIFNYTTGDLRAVIDSVKIEVVDENATAVINAGTTTIDPGKILIAGSSTLADWRNGADATSIEGGKIAANTVTANKLEIGSRGISIEGISFSYDKATNKVSWTAGIIRYTRADGTASGDPDGYVGVSAGSATWTTGTLFIYWNKGATDPANGATVALVSTTAAATANGTNTLVLGTYKGGVNFIANYGQTIIDGTTIFTGTITATQIAANAITATQIAAGVITGDHIAANSISAKNMILSDMSNMAANGWDEGDNSAWTKAAFLDWYYGAIAGSGITTAGWKLSSLARDIAYSKEIPVNAGDVLYAEAWSYNEDPNAANLMIRFRLQDGTYVWPSAFQNNTKNAWVLMKGQITAPANAVAACLYLQVNKVSGQGNRCIYSKPIMRRAASAELIVDGAITANKISVSSLAAISANLGNVNIDAARINSGILNIARIGDLTVDTIKITNGAITSQVFSSQDQGGGLTSNPGQWVDILDLWVSNDAGYPIHLAYDVKPGGGGPWIFRILRHGTEEIAKGGISPQNIVTRTNGEATTARMDLLAGNPIPHGSFIDEYAPAGSVLYRLQLQRTQANTAVSPGWRRMTAIVTKR